MGLGTWLKPWTWRRPRDFASRPAALQPRLQGHRRRAAEELARAEAARTKAAMESERRRLIERMADLGREIRAAERGVDQGAWDEYHDRFVEQLVELDRTMGREGGAEGVRAELRRRIDGG
ncbi:hypothetical protein [Nocardiopsis baichengensis]|uniref:hypothetical protein n=1 Tax=Nocardiopsis baichengensis TaxID=280240 RepID=UPI000380F0B8|nr:hypothetical protein [Nocardiopsis baichengensis]